MWKLGLDYQEKMIYSQGCSRREFDKGDKVTGMQVLLSVMTNSGTVGALQDLLL